MSTRSKVRHAFKASLLLLVFSFGCPDGVDIDVGGIIDDNLGNLNGGDGGIDVEIPTIALRDFATNTQATQEDGATGIAVDPTSGEVFIVNSDGLFGPITEGTDVSTLEPFGATNLSDDLLFDGPRADYVLAITIDGEFWIASSGFNTVARVPAEGGDATAYTGLQDGPDASNVNPSTIALVPENFDGPDIDPGNLIFGEETSFSAMAVVNVTDGTVFSAANPDMDLSRVGHHFAFGSDGTLYAGRQLSNELMSGIQTIATDGSPTELPGTLRTGLSSFVVLDNGDLVIRGSFRTEEDNAAGGFRGLFFWSADDEVLQRGLELTNEDVSAADELVIMLDGTVLYAQSELNRVVIVDDVR